MSANERQVGGQHYKSEIQHWDYVVANNLDYFQGQITKYVTRWKEKGGLQDLEKAKHFLDKYIEVEKEKIPTTKDFKETLKERYQTDPEFKKHLIKELKEQGMHNPFGYIPELDSDA
jgi:hypothetical protein